MSVKYIFDNFTTGFLVGLLILTSLVVYGYNPRDYLSKNNNTTSILSDFKIQELNFKLDNANKTILKLNNEINNLKERTCSGDFLSSSNHKNIGTINCVENMDGTEPECNIKFNNKISITTPDYGISMLPAISKGDKIILDDSVEPVIGDFVYSKIGFKYGIHQIIDIENGRYTLKGVNNELQDMSLIYRDDIDGVVIGRLVGVTDA